MRAVLMSMVVCGLLWLPSAWAQDAADPGKVNRRMEERPTPSVSPAVEIPETDETGAPVRGDGRTFLLQGIRVVGDVTVFSAEELEALARPLVGQEVGAADLRRLARDITRKYRNAGYILSQAVVPEQRVEDGVVAIRVIEGSISEVRVAAEDSGLGDRLEPFTQPLEEARVLTSDELERVTLLIDDLPGITAEGVLHRSETELGAADYYLLVEETRADGQAQLDNRGTDYNGPYQLSTRLNVHNWPYRFSRTTLDLLATTDVRELRLFGVGHEVWVGTEGTRIFGRYRNSEQEPGEVLHLLDTESETHRFELGASHPFARSRDLNVFGRALFSTYDSRTDQLGTLITEDSIRALRVGGTIDWRDPWRGVNLVDLELSQGIKVFGASDEQDANLSRADGEPDFTKVVAYATRQQAVWRNVTAVLHLEGQLAFDPLLSSEEYALGGVPFGRAYDPSEVSGDHGLAAGLEVNALVDVPWPLMETVQPFVYYDLGAVWHKDDLPEDRSSLASAGAGLRFRFSRSWSGSLEMGKPLTAGVQTEDGDRPWRGFFMVRATF